MGITRRNFTCQPDFALISRVLSVVAVILQGVPAWTYKFSVFYSPTSRNDRKIYLLRIKMKQKIIFKITKLHFDAKKVFFPEAFLEVGA